MTYLKALIFLLAFIYFISVFALSYIPMSTGNNQYKSMKGKLNYTVMYINLLSDRLGKPPPYIEVDGRFQIEEIYIQPNSYCNERLTGLSGYFPDSILYDNYGEGKPLYYISGANWYLVASVGPDGRIEDYESIIDEQGEDGLLNKYLYDPTNGSSSSGDIHVIINHK